MREYILGSAAATTTTGITITGASTLNYLWPAAAPNANISFLRHAVGQAANATSAQQRIQFQWGKVPSGGSAYTLQAPVQLKQTDAASIITGATAPVAGKSGTGNSSVVETTYTSPLAVIDDNFNVLNGYLFVSTPPEAYIAPASSTALMRLWFPTAPGTVTGWNWYQVFAEV